MTTTPRYVPDRGDLVWLDFDPQIGHEQAGRRPALVISHAKTNGANDLAFVVPITNQVKGYDAEVPLPAGLPVQGVLLCDQTKSSDWVARRIRYVGQAPTAVVNAATMKVVRLIA
jgi:mRNA interferase MazF